MQLFILSVSLVLFVFYAALILYYAISWRSIPVFKHTSITGQPPTFSIIIPARNEAQNIKACLDSICNQSYPKELYEIIVVDDHSTDNSAAIIQQYKTQNVKLISLSEHIDTGLLNSYKKKAIEIAIAQSTGEMIVTTDADCYAPENWLQKLLLSTNKQMQLLLQCLLCTIAATGL
ncbi:MAG: glycosyltransferase [Chitinophagaceae bacterium]|nr:glycosyltransferase [Chitinophagaceae bacterium]